MRSRNQPQQSPLTAALQLLLYLVLFALAVVLIWALSRIALSWDVRAAGYIMGFFSLLGLSLLATKHCLRLFREARTEWRRTFRQRRK